MAESPDDRERAVIGKKPPARVRNPRRYWVTMGAAALAGLVAVGLVIATRGAGDWCAGGHPVGRERFRIGGDMDRFIDPARLDEPTRSLYERALSGKLLLETVPEEDLRQRTDTEAGHLYSAPPWRTPARTLYKISLTKGLVDEKVSDDALFAPYLALIRCEKCGKIVFVEISSDVL